MLLFKQDSKVFNFIQPLGILILVTFFNLLFVGLFDSTIYATAVSDILIVVFLYLFFGKSKLKFFQNSITNVFDKIPIFIYFIIIFALVYFASQSAGLFIIENVSDINFDEYSNALQGNSINETGVSLFLVLVLAPVSEELLYRGIFFTSWYKIHPIFGFVGSALVFAIVHGTLAHTVSAFLFGLFLALIYSLTGSILISISSHILYNTLVLFLSDAVFSKFFSVLSFNDTVISLLILYVFTLICLFKGFSYMLYKRNQNVKLLGFGIS